MWPRLGVTRAGARVRSAATPVAEFSAVLSIRGSFIRRLIKRPAPSVTVLMRQARADVEAAALSLATGEISEGSLMLERRS